MTAGKTVETRSMPKTQKTFYLNEELSTLVDAVAASTGASFTKIVTASLLHHLLDNPTGPDPQWMRAAVALEKGECGLADVPVTIAQRDFEESAAKRRDAETQYEADPNDRTLFGVGWCRDRYTAMMLRANLWKIAATADTGTPP